MVVKNFKCGLEEAMALRDALYFSISEHRKMLDDAEFVSKYPHVSTVLERELSEQTLIFSKVKAYLDAYIPKDDNESED